ncbi:hypothetical protein U14_01576 [Candidatus Moduliflexus flocculans]|uniref:DUF104 domain-containing protein n=1 Tax=Candidatus Moduliflexus flocculans TaxID=1499966 RepID=A0A0S6VWX5_9BACT|nr:hypothetical protein U14_01576 [Candidatus Moduliflexus flocculans]
MNAIHGIYHNGMIELSERPSLTKPVEVLVIFPEQQKIVKKVGGLCKDAVIDYDAMEDELRQLSQQTAAHILREMDGEYE